MPAGHVLAGGDDRQNADGHAQVGHGAGRLDRGGAAGHVALHVLHSQRGLERDAAGVERDRLADEPEDKIGLRRLRRVVAQDDQPGLIVARLGDRSEGAHSLRVDLRWAERLRRDVLDLRGDLGRARRETLGRRLVRRAVDEIAGAVRPLGDPQRAVDGLFEAASATDHQAVELRLRAVVLPAGRVVAPEERSFDDRARLLLQRHGQRGIKGPGDRLDELAGLRGHRCGSGAEGVGVDPLGLAEAGRSDAPRRQLPVHMHKAGGAELPAQLAFLGELAEQPIERSVELRCRARQPVAAGERNGEDISLHRTWRDLLHLDSHGRAMLADAPRTLRSACRGYTFAAFAPIEETWLAAHLFDACAQPDFGGAGAALRSSR